MAGAFIVRFIVRSFGTKDGINFDDVQKNLISPALATCDIQGGTTEPFLQAGGYRAPKRYGVALEEETK